MDPKKASYILRYSSIMEGHATLLSRLVDGMLKDWPEPEPEPPEQTFEWKARGPVNICFESPEKPTGEKRPAPQEPPAQESPAPAPEPAAPSFVDLAGGTGAAYVPLPEPAQDEAPIPPEVPQRCDSHVDDRDQALLRLQLYTLTVGAEVCSEVCGSDIRQAAKQDLSTLEGWLSTLGAEYGAPVGTGEPEPPEPQEPPTAKPETVEQAIGAKEPEAQQGPAEEPSRAELKAGIQAELDRLGEAATDVLQSYGKALDAPVSAYRQRGKVLAALLRDLERATVPEPEPEQPLEVEFYSPLAHQDDLGPIRLYTQAVELELTMSEEERDEARGQAGIYLDAPLADLSKSQLAQLCAEAQAVIARRPVEGGEE